MKQGSKSLAVILGLALALLIVSMPLAAKSPSANRSSNDRSTYIVILEQPSLAEWHRDRLDSPVFSPEAGSSRGKAPSRRLNARSADAQAYLGLLDEGFEKFRGDATLAIGRELKTRRRYRTALNGFSASLTAEEAQELLSLPQVRALEPDLKHKLHTDAGPAWLKADDIWNGVGSIPARSGEGVVIGVIDSGINWDHFSFSDPGGYAGSHDFINPYGSQLGLCSEPAVLCNDHLVGVYDFVTDDPDTVVAEENTMGEDNSGHGTHVSSIAAGNILQHTNNGITFVVSGVARFSNIVSYRVCYIGDPNDTEDGGCNGEDIVAAIDQAVTDGVDVINYSLGTGNPTISPWGGSVSIAFLNAFGAGIFVVSAAGNEGPAPSSIGYPANAPWISAAGNATHNRIVGAALEGLIGGDTPPPNGIFGATLIGTSGFRDIVHARDFGNSACGTGAPELGPKCDDYTGASSPFAPGTFNGEIVVCDRQGTHGRIEKGKNLHLAGAGGMILANTDLDGGSLRSDLHCLPAIHIGNLDGNDLRTWLDSGSGHKGSISGFDRIVDHSLGDQVVSSSSRGPSVAPVDVLKPNVIAPGSSILGAYLDGNSFAFLSGTSMSSPHIAGSAALLLSVHGNWTPSMIASALETTATPDRAYNFNGTDATPHDRGVGRPQLDLAANAGLYLNESVADFFSANPNLGGEPRDLNLPTLTDANCEGTCSFTRTVTDLMGGGTWAATATGFPPGTSASITPPGFSLGSGGSRTLTIDVDVSDSSVIGFWVYGGITLSAAGAPDTVLPVTVFSTGGELPLEINIFSDQNSGAQDFTLDGLAQMPQATFTSGGLLRPQVDSQFLVQDPTRNDPYDGGTGVLTIFHEVPEGTFWFHAESLDSTAPDVDLFVGRDNNEDGIADSNEEICSSSTPNDLELCDILNPTPGDYWIIGQNWVGSGAGTDEVFIESAVIGPGSDFPLAATGPGIIPRGAAFDLRLSWQDVSAVTGETLLGAVGLGTSTATPGKVGIIPIYFNRNGIADPKTFPLFDGVDHKFALGGLADHNRMFFDVPAGATGLTVTASGESDLQNNGLVIDLHRVEFDNAFSEAPFAADAPGGAPDATASGSGGNGPELMMSGGILQPGRFYTVIRNANPTASSVTVRAEVTFDQVNNPVNGNLLVSVNRGGISQGIDYQPIGPSRGLLWYTFTDSHLPTWYLSAGAAPVGDIWNGDLLRFTNNGTVDQFTRVGTVGVSSLAEGDSIFSWTLFGESGSERMGIVTGADTNPCPSIGGQATSISGFWGKAQAGLGGASVLLTNAAHAEIHYLYSDSGLPFWLQATGASGDDLVMSQFTGNCPSCASSPVSSEDVGVLGFNFVGESAGNWTLNYMLKPPLSGDINRNDAVVKISDVRACD
jgi:subtilisin family serine protease